MQPFSRSPQILQVIQHSIVVSNVCTLLSGFITFCSSLAMILMSLCPCLHLLWSHAPEELPAPPWLQHAVLRQFMLGPAGSGAAPHFHGPAINMLAIGRKEWFLFAPADAFFTVRHVAQWLRDFNSSVPSSEQASALEAFAGAPHQDGSPPPHLYNAVAGAPAGNAPVVSLRCVQLPGDAMVVPDLWGHAVLNKAVSLAIAVEFHL